MSDFLVDDWQSLIDKDVQELKVANNNVPPPPSPQQPQIPVSTQPKPTEPKLKKQKQKEQVVIEQPKEDKPRPLTNEEKRKAELLSRLANQNLIDDLFDGLSLQNKKASAAQIILKNEKSFQDFAKTVSQRFDQNTTPSQHLQDFCVELLITLFPLFESNELREVQQKLTVLKNEKKKQSKNKKKETKKETNKKEEEEVKKEKESVGSEKEKDLRYVPGMEDFM